MMLGLSASGAIVSGQPLAPGVTWATITATDALGRAASDRFAVVAFRPGLATPTLPASAPPGGYARLCQEQILQADEGCDFGFLRAACCF